MAFPRISKLRITSKKQGVRIDGRWILDLRSRLGITRERLALFLDVGTRTIARWEGDEITPDRGALTLLQGLDRVQRRVAKSIDAKDLVDWLAVPNEEFDGFPPLDLLRSGYATRFLVEALGE